MIHIAVNVVLFGGMISKDQTFTITVHSVLAEGVRAFNPFIPDLPAAGDHLPVLRALENAFIETGTIFSGNISDFERMYEGHPTLKPQQIRGGFKALAGYGYLDIDGDIFTPTQRFMKSAFYD